MADEHVLLALAAYALDHIVRREMPHVFDVLEKDEGDWLDDWPAPGWRLDLGWEEWPDEFGLTVACPHGFYMCVTVDPVGVIPWQRRLDYCQRLDLLEGERHVPREVLPILLEHDGDELRALWQLTELAG